MFRVWGFRVSSHNQFLDWDKAMATKKEGYNALSVTCSRKDLPFLRFLMMASVCISLSPKP